MACEASETEDTEATRASLKRELREEEVAVLHW